MLYLDTSLLVALLTPETETIRVREWFRGRSGQTLAVSPWVDAELSSALSAKIRAKELEAANRNLALSTYRGMVASSFVSLEILKRHFEQAAHWCADHRTGLRSADALHLAAATASGAMLCTLDRRLAASATALGLTVDLV